MADEDVTVEQEEQAAEGADTAEEELSDEQRALEQLKESVQLEAEDIGTLRKRLTITIPREVIDDRLNEQLSEKRREEIVPGFRRGRAPLKLVQKRFGKEIGEDLSTRLVLTSYLAVTERDGIKTLGDPALLVSVPPQKGEKGEPTDRLLAPQEALGHIKLPEDGPLIFKCEVDIQPEFELPALEGIDVKRPTVTVTDDDVEQEVQRLRGLRGYYAPVEEGAAIVEHDLLIGDLKVTAGDTVALSEENAQLAARDMQYGGILLWGLGEATVGKKAGITISLDTKIPPEFERAELRDRDAKVEFIIHDVKRLVVPDIDEALLDSMGFESEVEMRDMIRHEFEAFLDVKVHDHMRAQIDEYLIENTDFQIPAGISARQTERVVAMEVIDKLRRGTPEAQITQEIDSLRTGAAEESARELKLAFVMEKIAEDRDITVTEDEINGVINEIARRRQMRFDRVRDELAKGGRIDALYLRLRNDKIRDALLADAKISDVPPEESPPISQKKSAKRKTAKKSETKSEDAQDERD